MVAKEYEALLEDVHREEATSSLIGEHYTDAILAAVVVREKLSLEDVQTLAHHVVAQIACLW